MALESCVQRRDVEVVDGEHTLSLQERCTGFMGSRTSSCRDIIRCSVKVMVWAWRAFPGEGETRRVVLEGLLWTVCEQSDTHFMKIIPETVSYTHLTLPTIPLV